MKNYEKANAIMNYNNAVNTALNNVKERNATEIKKTEEFKTARMDAAVDTVVWRTQEKAVKDANPGISNEDLENALLRMGFNKPESEQESIERLQGEFLAIDQADAYAQFREELAESEKAVDEMAEEENIPTVYIRTAPSTTSSGSGRTYYTAREQYEEHRRITLENRERKRGASMAERVDANLNAWSEHLAVYGRKFRR